MARLTKYGASKLLNHLLGKAEFTMPTSCWLALFTADPGENGVLTNELTADGYARLEIAPLIGLSVAGGPVNNTDPFLFGPAAVTWPRATHGMIMDADSAGNGLMYAPLTDPSIVTIGKYLLIDIGLFSAALD